MGKKIKITLQCCCEQIQSLMGKCITSVREHYNFCMEMQNFSVEQNTFCVREMGGKLYFSAFSHKQLGNYFNACVR